MNKLKWIIFSVLCICISPLPVVAGDFDGSRQLLCAIIEAFECGLDGDCLELEAEDMNIPEFLNINFKEKKISGTRENGELTTTKIKNMVRTEGNLILQGIENGRAWSMVIAEATGKMVLTASGDQVGFVLFGACLPK